MIDLLSNYWVGLLVLGPVAGVLWSVLFGSAQQERARGAKYVVGGTSGQAILGDNNRQKQVKNSYNRRIVNNNFHGTRSKADDDAVGFAIFAIAGTLLLCSLLAWGMAKYGAVIVALEMALVSAIGVCLVVHLFSRFWSGEYQNNELPLSLVLVSAGSFAFFTVDNLGRFLRVDLSEAAYQYSNIFQFFWELNKYDKAYLLVQAICVIFVLLNLAYISSRTYFLQRGKCLWYVDALLLLPLLGVLPFWLSHPNWGINFVYEYF